MATSIPYESFLTPEQIEKFKSDGFLCIRDYLNPTQVVQLKSQISDIISKFNPSDYPIFTTNEQTRNVDPNYFLSSGDKIVPFMEERGQQLSGGTEVPFHLRINKIGHALHDQDPVFHAISYDPKIGRIARDLGLEVCRRKRIRPFFW
jgi:phytanoyl-CoA hydroxylase